jgi:hypothetical protein
MQPARARIVLIRRLLPALAALAVLGLAGCGMFNANANVGPDLKPHLGASVSMPLGK